MDRYKIAVATSDGIVVNQHFGHADKFYIYEIQDDIFTKVEVRQTAPACISR